jgi:type I restriction enzyme R subunit
MPLNPLEIQKSHEKKYQEVIAAYNADKDRATVEDTFTKLIDLANSLDDEQRRAIELGLTEDQLALFDLLQKGVLNNAQRERIKDASRDLLAELQRLIAPLEHWTEKEQTQAEVEVFILDHVYQALPEPPYTAEDKKEVAELVYRHVWQQSASGHFTAC